MPPGNLWSPGRNKRLFIKCPQQTSLLSSSLLKLRVGYSKITLNEHNQVGKTGTSRCFGNYPDRYSVVNNALPGSHV